jgi:ubiquinone/menaquinone biosynthesis C-methylase UbiE
MSDTPSDTYTHGHHASVVDQHRRRTAEDAAAFLLPHLEPSMSILDVGCGPGSITVGLAQRVPAGHVTGVDVVEDVLEQARELAGDSGLGNLTFETGDVYALGYEDDRFDVAYAHQVLQHLTDPVRALRELRRVTKPGGFVAIRDADYGTMVHAPDVPEIHRWRDLYHAVATRNDAEADAGRYLNGWMLEAGFEDLQLSGSTWVFHEPRQVLNWGDSWANRITQSALASQAVEYGLATTEELEAIAEGWRRWARLPDAFFSFLHIEALGRTPVAD